MICVFITGGNAVGKTTLARTVQEFYGGIETEYNNLAFCRDRKVAFVGRYLGSRKYGGVDSLNSTSPLKEAVEFAKSQGCDVVFAEGSYMNSFGLNLLTAMFAADKQLVVNLWANENVIVRRLRERSSCKRTDIDSVLKKQRQSMIAARKYQSIGVKVLQFNTTCSNIQEIRDTIIKTIKKL